MVRTFPTAISRFLLIFLVAAFASCAGPERREPWKKAAPEVKGKDPVAQRVSFSFKHELVGSALRSITVLTGTDISVMPEVLSPAELEKRTVSLCVEDMPLGDALDWLVRELDAGYQVGDKGCVWITREYLGIDEIRTEPIFVPGLYQEEGAADLVSLLKAAVRTVDLKRDVVLGARSGRDLLVTLAPGSAMTRIKEVVRSIGQLEAPAPIRISNALDGKLKLKMLCRFKVTSIDMVLDKVRKVTGLRVGYRQGPVDARTIRRTISMDAGHVTVKEVLDLVVALAGFDRWELEPDRGVWLYGPGEPKHPTSAEIPWKGTVVRSYPAKDLLKVMTAEKLEDAVRGVCGRAFPSTLVKFSAATQRLLVIEEPHVIHRVEDYLRLANLLSRNK